MSSYYNSSGARPHNADIREDKRAKFYRLEDIKHRSLGDNLMLSPYDAQAFLMSPDAGFLAKFANTEKIRHALPRLGFETAEAARKTLKGFMLRAEAQMGVVYFIRYQNYPVGMIAVNSPRFNKETLGLSIWTIDFFMIEQCERQGMMSVAMARAMREMKEAMGAEDVYAMVCEDNACSRHLLEKFYFEEIDNTGFHDTQDPRKTWLVYRADLATIRFA
ncbi:MAG: GNAT family N-acetyltransferase [Marinilabiliaceae bacterium]